MNVYIYICIYIYMYIYSECVYNIYIYIVFVVSDFRYFASIHTYIQSHELKWVGMKSW